MYSKFFERLNASDWVGTVCEVGIGMPFAYQLTSEPGASKTLLFSSSPYFREAQPRIKHRAVSKEMADALATRDLLSYPESTALSGKPRFALAVTASHKTINDRGATHGWICLKTVEPNIKPTMSYAANDEAIKTHFIHFSIKKQYEITVSDGKDKDGKPKTKQVTKDVSRSFAGAMYAHLAKWFINHILLGEYECWGEAIADFPVFTGDCVTVDVIDSEHASVYNHLELLDTTELLYHNGSFHRAEDYVRGDVRIYRGSFNPPTNAHLVIGEGSIFQLEVSNARKGDADLYDVMHRVRMLDKCGVPVLITKGYPLFAQLHKRMLELGTSSAEYIVGSDTFNDIINEKYIPNENFLEDFYYNRTGKFIINLRQGHEVKENIISNLLVFKTAHFDVDEFGHISATQAREGNLENVPKVVKEYIKYYDLYS